MRTAVLVTRTRWTEMPRLRHQIARALAGRYRVVFAETPTTWRDGAPTRIEEVEANVVRCQLTSRTNLPERVRRYVPGANDLVQARLEREIQHCLRSLGDPVPPVLVNFNHDATRIVESRRFAAKLYVCNDDWVAKAPSATARRVVARQEARVARAADVCLAVSYPLVGGLKRHNPNTRLFLPGHDLEVAEASAARPEAERTAIRVVFMGNVNRRIDVEWLSFAAAQPGIEVHTVGTVTIDPAEAARLAAAGVRFHEPKYGAELQQSLMDADVLVIPYLLHEDVLAVTASNKLFQYIAAEKPVVISNMPHFIDFGPGIIYRAHSKESFVEQIRTAEREDSEELRRRRREVAAANSWSERARELLAVIESVVCTAERDRKRSRRP